MKILNLPDAYGADFIVSLPSGSKNSGVFARGKRRFCAFVSDGEEHSEGDRLEELIASVNSAVEHRLPFLATFTSTEADNADSAQMVAAKLAILEARELIPTALIEQGDADSTPTGTLAATFDLLVLLGDDKSGNLSFVQCNSKEAAAEVFHQWLDIVPSSRESILVPEDSSSSRDAGFWEEQPGFWSERFVRSTFDLGSIIVFSDFKRHNIYAGLGLVYGIPTVFILPEVERNEASIARSDAYLILHLLDISSRFGIPLIFSVDGGSTYGTISADHELLVRIADQMRTVPSPIFAICREPVSDRSSLISHVAVTRSEATVVPSLDKGGDVASWRDEIAYRLSLGCRKFAARSRK